MAEVFISYSRHDQNSAQAVRERLAGLGHRVFLDTDRRVGLLPGDDWRDRLSAELRRADALVALVSSHSAASQWCTVEISTAKEQGKRILPLTCTAESSPLPLLGGIQHFDWLADPEGAIERVHAALRALDTEGPAGSPVGASPYPGLEAFDAHTAWAFVGRSAEIRALADLFRSPQVSSDGDMVVVLGPSGCGKSSLVRAGLLPALLEEGQWWTLPPLPPSDDPIGALGRAFAEAGRDLGLDWTTDEIAQRLRNAPAPRAGEERAVVDESPVAALATTLLAAAPRGYRKRLIIVLDQLEELLARASRPAQDSLARLILSPMPGPVSLVGTLRSDSLAVLQDSPLRAPRQHLFTLDPIRPSMLPTIVSEPARRAGYKVPRDLLNTLVADTGEGDALPLLAFTLNQLADGLGPGDELSMNRYTALGGVSATLGRQADLALRSRIGQGRRRDDVLASLLHLVLVDDERRPVRKAVPRPT